MRERPYAGDPGVTAVLGPIDDAVWDELRAIDQAIRDWRERLRERSPDAAWSTRGLQVADYPSPSRKRCLRAAIDGPVVFTFDLQRGDFYANHEETDRAPDAFYVEGEVYVDPPEWAPRGEPQWLVLDLPVTRHARAREAVAALATAIAQLREESERQAPTKAAWHARLAPPRG